MGFAKQRLSAALGIMAIAAAVWAMQSCGGADPIDDSAGARTYANQCAVCHGARAEGAPNWQERDSSGALPAPPLDSAGHAWHHADGLLVRIVSEGCAAYDGSSSPCNMPAFGDVLGDEEIRDVLEFMRSLWGDEERAFQEEVSRDDPLP